MSDFVSWEVPSIEWPTAQTLGFCRRVGGEASEWRAFVAPHPLLDDEGAGLFLRRAGDGCGFWAMNDCWPVRLGASHDDSALRMAGADVLNQGKIARFAFLNAQGELRREAESAAACFWLRPGGCGGWNAGPRAAHFDREWFVPFRLNAGEEVAAFVRRPFDQVWNEFQRARSDADSDVAWAMRWLGLNEAERDAQLYRWPRAEQAVLKLELEAHLHDILLCDETLWHDDNDWVLNLKTRDEVELLPFEQLWDEPVAPSPFLVEAAKVLWGRMEPFDEHNLRAHPCVDDWRVAKNRYFQGRATAPTSHERLEGMLRWRDWYEKVGA